MTECHLGGDHLFTLQDLLELPLLQSGRPEVLVGDDFERRVVRWVHTSEIFDISPLLKGGEVLFTTGLGLVGAPAGAITDYIDSLARQEVTALVMEVGRTFVELPVEFVDAARRTGFPLITLHRVIPFVEITETVHPLLVSAELAVLQRREDAGRRLMSTLLAGSDLGGLVLQTQVLAATPVGLYSTGGKLVAGSDVRTDSAADTLTELPVGPEPWAHLVAAGDCPPGSKAVLEVAAPLVALRLAQQVAGSPGRAIAVGDLLADMMSGRFLQEGDLRARAATLGFTLNPRRPTIAVAVDLNRAARTGLAAVTAAARRLFGPNLVAEVDGRTVLAVQLRADVLLESQLHALVEAVDLDLAGSGQGSVVRIVAGPIAKTFTGLAASLARARDGARLARRLSFPARVVTERDLGLHDLLTRVVPDADLEAFVSTQLGPLLQADARSGQRLVETLHAYLSCGRSKTAAAAALGVRRQTMYQRLERISGLLGGVDLTAHDRLVALDLAVMAWRMRTSGLTGLPPKG